jgi:ribulose-5-phosphate 4-epimerase/fuculose-1-phosphate aldolase
MIFQSRIISARLKKVRDPYILSTGSGFNEFCDFYTRHHDLMPAFYALQLVVHTRAQHSKPVATAGMELFHDDNIARLYIHAACLLYYAASIC